MKTTCKVHLGIPNLTVVQSYTNKNAAQVPMPQGYCCKDSKIMALFIVNFCLAFYQIDWIWIQK